MTTETGIYVIEHRESGKKYVGSSARSFKSRWEVHRRSLRKDTHHSVVLQRAWDKYGEDAFLFRIIEPCLPEHATGVEQVFMDWYKSTDPEFGYNLAPIAGSPLGYKHTDETKKKMSASAKGHKRGLGFKHSDEAKAKMSLQRKGRPKTAEHCAKLSAKLMGNKYNLGHKASAETRAKQSAAALGNKYNLGCKHTPDQKAARSVFIKAAWARRKGVTDI